jgi:hypothetical protein
MATASDLITAAANKVGIYSLTTAQTTTCLNSLNSFVSVLAAEELLYTVTGETLAITASDPEYTIGSGGDLATARPTRIDKLFLRDSDGYDFNQDIISVKEYNEVFLKTTVVRPERVYFLPEYPLAKIIFESYPDQSYTAYIDSWKPITVFASAGATMSYPPEYEDFFIYNLAVRIGEDWDRRVAKSVMDRAEDTKEIVSSIFAKSRPPAKAEVDPFLQKSYYNINYDF